MPRRNLVEPLRRRLGARALAAGAAGRAARPPPHRNHLGQLPKLEGGGEGVGSEDDRVDAVAVEQVEEDDERGARVEDDAARGQAPQVLPPLPEADVVPEGERVKDDVEQPDQLHQREAVEALLGEQLA